MKWTLVLGLTLAISVARADPPRPTTDPISVSAQQLSDLHAQLALSSADKREAALAELLALDDQDLPSIRQRLRVLSGDEFDHAAWLGKLPALTRTRAAEPNATADDQAVGLRAALEQDRSPAMLAVVELFALLRALENQRTLAASDVLVNELFAIEPRLFKAQLPGTRKRLGKRLVPAYLRARAQGTHNLQKLATDGLAASGMTSDVALYAERDPDVLAATITVQSELGRAELPYWVALLDDQRPAVRRAARVAVRRHVDGALDLLRQRSADLMGEEPDPSWNAQRTLDALLAQIDGPADAEAIQALQRAQTALRGGGLTAVEQALDQALAAGLTSRTQTLASAGYLALGEAYDKLDQTDRALWANRRALRLATPGTDEARRAKARVLYLEAEQRAGRGIADLTSLHSASELEPERTAAAALGDELAGLRSDRDHERKKLLGFVAAGLLTLAALLLLRIRAQVRKERMLEASRPRV